MGKLFGTDGVRGIANKELTVDLVYKLGQAGAQILTSEMEHVPKILVGMDTRISKDMLESALSAGICSVGAEVIFIGVVPTPAVAYLIRLYNADAGVVISASHNPFEFNGIKFFDNKGYKLSDDLEEKIESIIFNDMKDIYLSSEKIGTKTYNYNAVNDYEDYILSIAKENYEGIKVVLDCANGASYKVAPEVFKKLGAEVIVINDNPNGVNINYNCGSTHMNQLKESVLDNKADIGIAFDGDADRVLAVDENGNLIDGDQIMSIIGLDLKKSGKLKNNTIVATVMSNLGFDILAKKENFEIVKTNVGDRYVLQEMLTNEYIIGGEQSGHVIFLEHNTTGDGLLTAVQLINVLKRSNRKMSQLSSVMEVLPQVLINAKVRNENKNKFLEDIEVSRECKRIEDCFQGNGRVLIRPSGTEPLVRVMIEGKDINQITKEAEQLSELIEKRLG